MTADTDGDSRMASSPEDADILSPPESQQRSTTGSAVTAAATQGANANGKRPINTISNGADEDVEVADATTPSSAATGNKQDFSPRTHQASGYTWNRIEAEPGYAWSNKKAVEEANRTWDTLVHREGMVKGRYGDPFEVVEKERAVANSLKQR